MFLLRDDINEIAAILNEGGVICYPTDTIWGIGCNITEETAVDRIRTLKKIPAEEGLIILVNSIDMLKKYVPDLPPVSRRFYRSITALLRSFIKKTKVFPIGYVPKTVRWLFGLPMMNFAGTSLK